MLMYKAEWADVLSQPPLGVMSQPPLFSIQGGTFLRFYRCRLISYQLTKFETFFTIFKKQYFVRRNNLFLCSLLGFNEFKRLLLNTPAKILLL